MNMTMRKVQKTVGGAVQYDGAGVKLVRVIGYADVKDFDPFLMLDAFDSTGILHQEMPQPVKKMLGVQLWLNLPRKDKMVAPKYHDIRAEQVPVITEEGSTVRVIAGNYKGIAGAEQGDHVKMTFLDVEMKAGAKWNLSTEQDATLFIYIVEGSGRFGGENESLSQSKRGLLFQNGDEFMAQASEDGLRFLLFAGKPLKEPIAWGGPIVMNITAGVSGNPRRYFCAPGII